MAKEQQNKTNREFGLTTLSVNNRTTVFFLSLIIFVAGLVSYESLPKESFPEVKLPTIYVGTVYFGNSPSDIENLVTRPIEKEINSVNGVDKITSTSIQDYSTIIVEFESDIDVDKALQDVKDAVDKSKSELPDDLDQDPDVFELDLSEMPIMNINLSGDYSFNQLKTYAEQLEDDIEQFQEISDVEIRGLPEQEVKVEMDLHKMQSLEITFDQISRAISSENVTISGGSILTNGYRRNVRILGEFENPKELEEIIVKDEKQQVVYLKDIADISFDFKERESFARLEGEPVVMLDVIKRSGENLLNASDKINALVEQAQEDYLPADLSITITLDQSNNTRNSVSDLENNIISGVILVVLVLLFFLGTRNALFVGIAIPMSMFLSFVILGVLGITINIMVLFGLIMALGMLVDNGIVVVENIYRLMDEGKGALQAAREGVGEVAWPIIASTATTLAAFLPLAIWPGIIGQFMKFLPYTLIIVLSSSLFVALVINPVFTATFMKLEEKYANRKTIALSSILFSVIGISLVLAGYVFGDSTALTVLGNLFLTGVLLYNLNIFVLNPAANSFQKSFLPWLENAYEKTINFALRGKNDVIIFSATVVLMIASIALFFSNQPRVVFFPVNEPNYINVFIEKPIGTDIKETNEFAKMLSSKVDSIIEPYRDVVLAKITQVGKGTSDPGDPSSAGNQATPHKARISVEFVTYEKRNGLNTTEVLSAVRDAIGRYPGVAITVDKNAAGPPTGKPINIEISGEDLEELRSIAGGLRKEITESSIEGYEELKTDLETGKPEMRVLIDRKKARRLGLSTYAVANDIRTALFGSEVSQYKQGEDDYDIQLRYQDQYRYNSDMLMNHRITFRDQLTGKIVSIPISAVADTEYGSSYGSIKRKDLDRVVTIYSNVLDGYNATEIVNEMKELLKDFSIPKGYEVKFTGEQEQQQEEMQFLSMALLVALFLILFIIIAQFNRISAPFIIMTSVVLSTIGVFLGLFIFDMSFVVIMTMLGIISLAGVVVNNAIVLLDYTLLLKERKIEDIGGSIKDLTMDDVKQVIAKGGKTRLRPVLLTAITTVLGLIPLAIGLNIDFVGIFTNYDPNIYFGGENTIFWAPMSWTIIFGIIFATFLTLVVVPVMFLLTEKIKFKLNIRR